MPTQTFSDTSTANGTTGAAQTFVVPADTFLITMECWGAEGMTLVGPPDATAGKGGYIRGQIPVTPGETLQVYVGGHPTATSTNGAAGGYNGGGRSGRASTGGGPGGGASDVRRTPYTLFDRLIVGGGGGGGSYAGVGSPGNGGGGAYPTGQPSTAGGVLMQTQAQGGTASAGGAGGTYGAGSNGNDGTYGVGGEGYAHAGTPTAPAGGGGGGGWYGGGGGGEQTGGGGGSSAVPGGGYVTSTTNSRSGGGQVVFTWTPTTLPTPTADDTGWEVRVYERDDPTSLIAVIPRWSELSWSRPLNDVGGGSIQILRDDPVFTQAPPTGITSTLVDDETMWKVYQDGDLRAVFFAEDVDLNHADDNGRPTVKIAGRGPGKLMAHAISLPPGYPTYTTKDHTWTGVSVMHAWWDLYEEARVRGVLPTYLSTSADNTYDTVGYPYPDVSDTTQPPGQTVLDLLGRWAPVASVDWEVDPDFIIQLKHIGLFGQYRNDKIVVNVGGSILNLSEKKTRRGIATNVFFEANDGSVSESDDSGAVTKWGRRELWLTSGDGKGTGTAAAYAAATLASVSVEARQVTVVIEPGTSGTRRPLSDFVLGDWLGVEFDAFADKTVAPNIDVMRVVNIAASIDEHGKATWEVTFQTRLEESILLLKQTMARLTGIGADSSSKTASQINPAQIIQQQTLDQLSDVVITSPSSGQILQWNGTDWVNVAASGMLSVYGDGADGSVTLTQASSAPSGMTKTGSGTSTQFSMTRNWYFTNLTLDASGGAFLFRTNGWRVYVRGTLTIGSGITMHNDGNAASGQTGGTAPPSSTVNSGAAGGDGGGGSNGTVGGSAAGGVCIGGNGGAGGNETTGAGSAAGGAASGTVDPPRTFGQAVVNGGTFRGGAGGGGGDGAVASIGGGGGGGGGVVVIACQVIANSGTIRARGGAGANAVSGNAGGGGGGGGGGVIIFYGTGTTGTVSAPGGAHGNAGGGGTAGVDGSAGQTYLVLA